MNTIETPETRTAEARLARRTAPNLRMPDWGAAGWAGLIAGSAFMLAELLLLPWSKGGNAWVPVRMVAAMIFGPQILPPPPYFAGPAHAVLEPTSGMFLMAVALHFSLSL